MRKLVFLFIALQSLATHALAQDSTVSKPVYINNYWAIKMPLLNLVDITSPNLMLGVERRFTDHSGIQLLAGISIVHPELYEYGGPRGINGYRVKGEYRYYLPFRRKNLALYVAPELFYTKFRYTTAAGFEDTLRAFGYDDTFTVHKENYGGHLKFGFHSRGLPRNKAKRLIIDAWAGLGLRNKTTTHTGRINPADIMFRPRHPNMYYEMNNAASGMTFSMALNFAVGYVLGK